VKAANLALRFVLELCLLAALAYSGLQVSVVLAAVAPLAAATVWGLFISPRARYPLPRAWWVLVQIVLFGIAVAGLVATGHGLLGALFGVIIVLNLASVLYWHQSDTVTTHASP
jgi:hypothetical protein